MPRERNKKSNIAIWKIDTTINIFDGKTTAEVIDQIGQSYKKRDLEPLPLRSETYEGKKVKVLYTQRFSDGWEIFLGDLLPDNLTEKKRQEVFHSINKDLILFIYDDSDIFAITSGAGYFIIENFIDERFPFEIAKRMLAGGFKSADVRDLTGLVYSQSRNFRRDYNFSRREAFGKVWKKLTGKIDSSVLKGSQYINDFLGDKSKKVFNADIKSSFTFRKTVTLSQVVSVVKETQKLLRKNPTTEQQKAFSFLDTLKEITNKKTKELLNDALVKSIYDFITSTARESDFDFCHPKEVSRFLHGTNYEIKNGISWLEAPSASDVLLKLRESNDGVIDISNFDTFKEFFLKLQMSFQEDDDAAFNISGDLLKYFHGEIDLEQQKFFFIDGRWYQVVGDFLKRLAEDFQEEVFGEKPILTSDVPFISWNVQDESEFNKVQAKENNFYFGDRIFLKQSEKGKIELFDLLYVNNGKVFIIQVKDGFGASIRDACSQIQMAAEIIENAFNSKNFSELNSYYKQFKKENTSISEPAFLKILEKERYYVLAISHKENFTRQKFIDKEFQSEIAKFEILGVSHEFRANLVSFNMAHIKKI